VRKSFLQKQPAISIDAVKEYLAPSEKNDAQESPKPADIKPADK
jgi:hypothetical protein